MKTKENKRQKIRFVTLGCSKNLYDSEKMMGQLKAQGKEASDGEEGGIVVINTCGFIGDAKEESINTILELCEEKQKGKIDRLYVTGCLVQRYKKELEEEIPQVDGFYTFDQVKELFSQLGADYREELVGERFLTTPSHYAYLKISEGCDRKCSFCAIPMIRGRHRSTPLEELVAEAENLARKGVKELILIAQDLTCYGIDLYRRQALADLLKALVAVEGIEWIRLHYAFPANFPQDVLELMASEPKICKYIDIPLQHISDSILKSMKRGITSAGTDELLENIRAKVPGIAIRTTLIVGYPSETREDFEHLKQWVGKQQFDRLGCFAYCEEEGTSAALLRDDVPEEEKQQRVAELMALQQEISVRKNQEKVGRTLKVLIDREDEDFYIGRTEWDSPEVDNDVFIDKKTYRVPIGEFVRVNITSAGVYDLFGIPVP